MTGVENAGLENVGPFYGGEGGMQNARPTVMERRRYKKSKEDEAFIAQ